MIRVLKRYGLPGMTVLGEETERNTCEALKALGALAAAA